MRGYRALVVGGMVLVLCFVAPNPAARRASAEHEADQSPPAADLLWKRSVPLPVSLTSSPDGRYIGIVAKNGATYCFGDNGRLAWKVQIPGVDRVVVSPNGAGAAYAFLNPTSTTVHFITPDGQMRWEHKVEGAIWSAAASSEPGCFAVGTGERYCYYYTLSERRQRYRRWRLPGAPCTTSFSPDGQVIFFGTWQDAGVAAFDNKGKQIAWSPGQPDRLYEAQLSASGQYCAVTARPNRTSPEVTVSFRNSGLDDLWTQDLQVHGLTDDISPGGDYLALGYQRVIAHKDKEIREDRVALYNRGGQVLWEKGGSFTRWKLVALCPSGRLLVHDEGASLYVLDRSGKILLKRGLPARVRSFAKTPQRNKIAIYCGNGELCVFAVR